MLTTSRLAVALLLLTLCLPCQAAGEKAKEAELASIRQRIESIRNSLQAEARRRDALSSQLQTAEMDIQAVRERLIELRQARQAAQSRLEDLQSQRAMIESEILAERSLLASGLKLAYMNGREEQLRLLLNQVDPARLGRTLTYYGYLSRMRARHISRIEEQLAHLQSLSEQVSSERDRLQKFEEDQARQVDVLAQARRERARALAAVKSELKRRGSQLARLEREAKGLEKLIAELRRAAVEFPAMGTGPFARARGKLPWPVKGRLLARFGQPRGGGLTWQGVLIGSSRGTQVRAPYAGRVMYADWLPGLGLLTVIDHGGGFMSLYGHNEQLFRKVGDRVAAGDVISVVAEGSASHGAGLYFEVRKGKQALDPLVWLSKP